MMESLMKNIINQQKEQNKMKKHHLKWQENEAKMKAKSTTEIAQMVTGLVTEALTQGHIPWNKPWASAEIG